MTTSPFFDQNFDDSHRLDVDEQPILDGRYQLVEKIGEGAMGLVFRACQLSTGQDVAIKLIKRHGAGGDALLQRFQREAAIIAELRHPHIVRLLDIGKDEELDLAYIAMEYVHGTTLGHYLHDQPEPMRATVNLALHIVMQVCNALTEPHSKGIIHRDIKPDNILLGVRSDELLDVKLLDFGVAHVSPNQKAEVASHRLTSTGCIVGTPHYLAPELCHTSQAASVASDLYAVGVLLFELLAGYSPFNGESVVDILFRHANQDVPRVSFGEQVDPELGESLNALIGELLHKMPEHRPGSALEVSQRILGLMTAHEIMPPMLDHDAPVKSLSSYFERSTQHDAHQELKETNLSPVPQVAYIETIEEGIAPQQIQGMTLKGTGEPKDHIEEDVVDDESSEDAYGDLAASLHALPPVKDPEHESPLRTQRNSGRTMEFLAYNVDDDDYEAVVSMSFLESMTHKLPMIASAAAFVIFMMTGAVMLSTGTIKEAESAPTPDHVEAPSPVALLEDTSSRSVDALVSAVPTRRVAMNKAPEPAHTISEEPPTAPAPAKASKPEKNKSTPPPSTSARPKAAPKKKRDHVRWLYSK